MPSRSRTESSATTTRTESSPRSGSPIRRWSRHRGGRRERRSDRQAPQPGPATRIGAADAVVGDLDDERPVVTLDDDPGGGGRRVLDDVGQRLGDDEVGGELDRLRDAVEHARGHLDRERRPAREGLDRRREPRSESTAGGFRGRARGALRAPRKARRRRREERLGAGGIVADGSAGEPEVEGERDEALLGAVVEVALQPAALGEAERDHPRPRVAQLLDLARSSASSRSFSSASAAVAPTASISSGWSSNIGSWIRAATLRPSRRTSEQARSLPAPEARRGGLRRRRGTRSGGSSRRARATGR